MSLNLLWWNKEVIRGEQLREVWLILVWTFLLTFQEFFHPEELMQMVVGCQDYDFRELEEVAEEIHVQYPVLSTRKDRSFSVALSMQSLQ